MPVFEWSWALLALIASWAPWLAIRAWTMGIFGMFAPKRTPLPASQRPTHRHVVCCEHNRCPDRPKYPTPEFEQRPWRCPQCRRWWSTREMRSSVKDDHLAILAAWGMPTPREWYPVSESAGDGYVERLV